MCSQSTPGIPHGEIRTELLFLTHSLYTVNSKVPHCDCMCCLGSKSLHDVCTCAGTLVFLSKLTLDFTGKCRKTGKTGLKPVC